MITLKQSQTATNKQQNFLFLSLNFQYDSIQYKMCCGKKWKREIEECANWRGTRNIVDGNET